MAKNWLRFFELQLLAKEGEKSIVISDFKVKFKLEWWDSTFPRVATVRVYNLAQETINAIMAERFAQIKIIAGYEGSEGLIFSGDIIYALTGKDNPVDRYTVIQARDGDNAFISASTNRTLARGYTFEDIKNCLMEDFGKYGITEGKMIKDFPPTVFPRGKAMFGQTRDYFDWLSRACQARWQIVDGKLNMVRANDFMHEAIVLNSETGLIGIPNQTLGGGVNAQCLINPNIRLNGLIEINQASINSAELMGSDISGAGSGNINVQEIDGNLVTFNTQSHPAVLATDGLYVVRGMIVYGETRGQPWYMELVCQAVGAPDLSNPSVDRKILPQ